MAVIYVQLRLRYAKPEKLIGVELHSIDWDALTYFAIDNADCIIKDTSWYNYHSSIKDVKLIRRFDNFFKLIENDTIPLKDASLPDYRVIIRLQYENNTYKIFSISRGHLMYGDGKVYKVNYKFNFIDSLLPDRFKFKSTKL